MSGIAEKPSPAAPEEREATIQLGVVLRRQPGVTRWQKWIWRAVAVLPGAAPADWALLREEDGAAEFHAATLPLTLHRKETEPYRVALAGEPPVVFVVLRPNEGQAPEEFPLVPFLVTASPYEAQDYADSGEESVERIAMPPALVGWISDFVGRHHVEEVFKKRRRDRVETDTVEDGRGDRRVMPNDVFRSPAGRRAALAEPELDEEPLYDEAEGPVQLPGEGRLH
ncbi:MAG: DUF3305 domain-containing protein [Pseudomonadota bacterium]